MTSLLDIADEATARHARVVAGIVADFNHADHVLLAVPSYGWTLLVHRSTSGPPYRVTRFDAETQEPLGHSEHEDIASAAEEAYMLVGHSNEIKRRYG